MKKLFNTSYTSWPGTTEIVPTPKVSELYKVKVRTNKKKEVNHV